MTGKFVGNARVFCSFCGKPRHESDFSPRGGGCPRICKKCLSFASSLFEKADASAEEGTSDASCTFCSKPLWDVGFLVTGEGNFYICRVCATQKVQAAEEKPATVYPEPLLDGLNGYSLEVVLSLPAPGQEAKEVEINILLGGEEVGLDRLLGLFPKLLSPGPITDIDS